MTTLLKPVRRVTQVQLDAHHGKDRHRRLVVTLIPGNGDDVPDLLELRPERTRRGETVALPDVYTWLLKCRVNAKRMESLRKRKAQLAAAKEHRRARRIILGGRT